MKAKLTKAKRIIPLILSAVLVLSACGCGSENVVYHSDTVNISCSWWGNDNRNAYTMEGVRLFEQQNPDIQVNCKYSIWNGYVKRQNVYMLSHQEPDVMLINHDWISKYSPDGNGFYDLYQLKDYIDLSNYTPSELSYGESGGKLNAIPIAFNTQTIYYNKDMYDEYGLDIPTDWDDFFEAAKAMRKDGIYPISMGSKSLFFFLCAYFEQTTGRAVCNEKGELTLTKNDIAYMLEFYKRLIDEKALMPLGTSDYNTFVVKKSAATMRWVSGAENYCSVLMDEGVNVVVGPYPRLEGSGRSGWYVKPATMYAISADTKNPEAAAKLLNFFVNNRDMALLQKTEKGIPISDAAQEALKEEDLLSGLEAKANDQLSEYREDMTVMYPVMENENVYEGFKNEAVYYLYNKDTLENVADKIYKSFYEEQ